ncbi:MAG: protein-disulfide reductase DsbD domain-containing protein [Pseudomonadota bacterium]
MARLGATLTLSLSLGLSLAGAAHGEPQRTSLNASAWVTGPETKVRLIGFAPGQGGTLYAGLQIRMTPGWKTYWRAPGEGGGVPPLLTLNRGSRNIKRAVMLFPAPVRLADLEGDSIGYRDGVVLPVRIARHAVSRRARLDVDLFYGVCRDVCIPVQVRLAIDVPPGGVNSANVPERLAAALDALPKTVTRDRLPRLEGARLIEGPKRRLEVTALFAANAKAADLFALAPPGTYLPMARRGRVVVGPQRVGPGLRGKRVRFKIPLRGSVDLKTLYGQPLTFTLVSERGSTQQVWSFPLR